MCSSVVSRIKLSYNAVSTQNKAVRGQLGGERGTVNTAIYYRDRSLYISQTHQKTDVLQLLIAIN